MFKGKTKEELRDYVKKSHKGDFVAFGEELKKAGAEQLQAACKALQIGIGKDKDSTIKAIVEKAKENGEKKKEETPQLGPKLIVDKKLKGLIPRPTGEDYKRTKESIRLMGMYEKIKVLKDGRIIDGFTRYQILQELKVPITWEMVEVVDISSDDQIESYMIIENINRRHLTDLEKIELVKKHLPKIKEETAKERTAKLKEVASKIAAGEEAKASVPPKSSRQKLAERAGVSEAQVQREAFLSKYAPDILEEGNKKGTTIGDMYARVQEWWKAVKRFSKNAETEEDKGLFERVKDGKEDLGDAFDYVMKKEREKPPIHKPGPMEKLAGDMLSIYHKVLLEKYEGKADYVPDKWEQMYLERGNVIVEKMKNSRK